MAIELRRKCGFRKVGGVYLVGPVLNASCGLFPILIQPCVVCGREIPFQQSPVRINPREVLWAAPADRCWNYESERAGESKVACRDCPLAFSGEFRNATEAMLLWIGRKSYSPQEFLAEAASMGISRRLPTPTPAWIKPGETLVLIAHLDAVPGPCPGEEDVRDERGPLLIGECRGGKVRIYSPKRRKERERKCRTCSGRGELYRPGVIAAFRPTALEQLFSDATPAAEIDAALEKDPRLTAVIVPALDPDHQEAKRAGAPAPAVV